MDLLLMVTNTNGPKNTLKSLLSPLHFKTTTPQIANKCLEFFSRTIPIWSQKLKTGTNALKKSRIMSCHTDFAVISTDFVRWGCYFT
jgi:hypothetical protein